MFILKCTLCGYEQIIKKRIDKNIYYKLTHCKELRCNRNKCREEHDYSVPKGYIQICFYFGNWHIIDYPTIEDLKAIKRAKELVKIGMEQFKNQ